MFTSEINKNRGKKMKHYIKIALIILLALVFMVFLGCEGPEGPAGADGADGIDGIDGTDITDAACLRCHSDDRLFEKRFQLNQHDHSTFANSLSRGTSGTCGRCHSHESFLDYVTTGEFSARESVTPLTCKSCHTLHNTEEVDDFSFALVADGDVEFLTGGTETFGKISGIANSPSNLCINCHQPRRDYTDYDPTPDDATDDVSLTSSHAGPHYGITSSVVFGKGADDRNGTVALDQGPGTHASAGCVTCHMGEGRNHTFKPDTDNCATCHAGTSNFDINGVPTKMHDAVHAIELAFVALGALEDDGEGGFDQTASSSDPTILTGTQFSAFWNYTVLHSDHGSAYHNPPYVKAIINSIEEGLGLALTIW